MAEFELDVKGFEQLERNLKKLDQNNMLATFRASVRASGRVIVKAARNNLPANYNTLRKALTVKPRRQRSINELKVNVGPTTGKNARYNGWYGHFVEYGITPHDIPSKKKRNLKNRKNKKILKFNDGFYSSVKHKGVKAHPFLRPAVDQNLGAVQKAYVKTLMKNIKKRLI